MGNGRSDLDKILDQFPREFTIFEVMEFFEWTNSKARTAIDNGQVSDALRLARCERVGKRNSVAIYENVRWRQQWLKRAWGDSNVRDMESNQPRHL